MVAVVAHDKQLALRHGDRIVERLAVFGVAQIGRFKRIRLVQRLSVDVDDARVKVNIHRLPADCDHTLDQQFVILGKRRRIQNDDIALLCVPIEKIALQHQIVLIDQRGVHRAAAHAVQTEKEYEDQRDDRQHPHQIEQAQIRLIALGKRLLFRLFLRFGRLCLQILVFLFHTKNPPFRKKRKIKNSIHDFFQ